MKPQRLLLAAAACVLVVGLGLASRRSAVPVPSEPLPTSLSDRAFWKLSTDFSEPDGTFHSENLVSNEARFQTIVPTLLTVAVPERAYVGVGSEQNFTYIAAVRPKVVFIVDIRRGNLDLHLIYKALFELSDDRADFVARLFSRKRPAGLTAASAASDIFTAFASAAPSPELYAQNLRAIEEHLAKTHGFALSAGDRDGMEFVYHAWFRDGPDIHYTLNNGSDRGGGGNFPTYADLMTADDGTGVNRSYLASEETFQFLKDLETRNMLVPVVGNFGGPKALRAVAAYLAGHRQVVSAFYASNVEQYLRQDGIWSTFCANAATMPADRSSVFIHSARGGFSRGARGFGNGIGGGFALEIVPLSSEVAACARR